MASTERVVTMSRSAWTYIGTGDFTATNDSGSEVRVTSGDDATVPAVGSAVGSPLGRDEVLQGNAASGLHWFGLGTGNMIVQDGA